MSKTRKLIAGVDGGGTKTIVALLDEEGHLFGRVRCAATNYRPQNAGAIVDELKKSITQLCREAKLPAERKPDILSACLSGLGRADARQHLKEQLSKADIAAQIVAESDAMAALYGAFSGRSGIIIIAGTGSIAFGKAPSGTTFRCGGWGYLLGDEGSGFDIGRNAITAALQAVDGRGPATSLRNRLEAFFQVETIDQAVTKIYEKYATRGALAQCAPLVFEEAKKGDAVALDIVTSAAAALAKLVLVLLQKMASPDAAQVALLGNLFHNALLHANVVALLQKEASELKIVKPDFPADIGAALLGLEKCGVPISHAATARLKAGVRNNPV